MEWAANPCAGRAALGMMLAMRSSNKPEQPVAKVGDSVKVHYTCKLEDGSVFATSRNKEPLEFEIGGAELIPGLQEAVVGMAAGETKTVSVPPEMAYGPYHEEMTATIDRSMVPPDIKLEMGVSLKVKHADGHESNAFVTELTDTTAEVDGNHPLAGKNLVLDLELLELAD